MGSTTRRRSSAPSRRQVSLLLWRLLLCHAVVAGRRWTPGCGRRHSHTMDAGVVQLLRAQIWSLRPQDWPLLSRRQVGRLSLTLDHAERNAPLLPSGALHSREERALPTEPP